MAIKRETLLALQVNRAKENNVDEFAVRFLPAEW
jgi:hypothetical protein